MKLKVGRIGRKSRARVEDRLSLFPSPSPFRSREAKVMNHERIYDAVRRIPRGKVATYGQVARTVGRCTARMVGYAMAALRGRTGVPWQRVINCKGEISARAAGDGSIRQRRLLEAEGIRFDSRGRVDLNKVRWKVGRETGRDWSGRPCG